MAKKRINWANRTFMLILGLFGIFAILFALNLVFAAPSQNEDTSSSVLGSTYSDAASGGALLYGLLQKLGFQVIRSRHPLEAASIEGSEVDVIWHVNSIDPPVTPDEVDWVGKWVDKGGTLILVNNPTLPSAAAIQPEDENAEDPLLLHWLNKFQLSNYLGHIQHISQSGELAIPHRIPVKVIKMPTKIGPIGIVHTYEKRSMIGPLVYRFGRNDTSTEDHSVISDAHGVVIARMKYGDGMVWLVSDPYLFSNLLIQEEDNAPLAVALAMSSKKGGAASILFDEYHLGFVQTVTIADAARTPVGKSILYLGAVVVLMLGTAGARFGRPRKGMAPIGVSQRSFVTALAELWLAGNAYSAAADALWKRYHSRNSVRRKGLDEEMDRLRKASPRADELLDIAKKLD